MKNRVQTQHPANSDALQHAQSPSSDAEGANGQDSVSTVLIGIVAGAMQPGLARMHLLAMCIMDGTIEFLPNWAVPSAAILNG